MIRYTTLVLRARAVGIQLRKSTALALVPNGSSFASSPMKQGLCTFWTPCISLLFVFKLRFSSSVTDAYWSNNESHLIAGLFFDDLFNGELTIVSRLVSLFTELAKRSVS